MKGRVRHKKVVLDSLRAYIDDENEYIWKVFWLDVMKYCHGLTYRTLYEYMICNPVTPLHILDIIDLINECNYTISRKDFRKILDECMKLRRFGKSMESVYNYIIEKGDEI